MEQGHYSLAEDVFPASVIGIVDFGDIYEIIPINDSLLELTRSGLDFQRVEFAIDPIPCLTDTACLASSPTETDWDCWVYKLP